MSKRGKSITAQERDYIIDCYKNFKEPITDRKQRTLNELKPEAMRILAEEMQPRQIPKDDITRWLAGSNGGRRGLEAADEILRLRWIVAELINTKILRK